MTGKVGVVLICEEICLALHVSIIIIIIIIIIIKKTASSQFQNFTTVRGFFFKKILGNHIADSKALKPVYINSCTLKKVYLNECLLTNVFPTISS